MHNKRYFITYLFNILPEPKLNFEKLFTFRLCSFGVDLVFHEIIAEIT